MRDCNKIDIVEGLEKEFKEDFDFENLSFIKQIYKTIRAFANTNGGILFIGINDSCEVVGIPQEKVDLISRHLCDTFKDKVELVINSKLHKNKKWYLEIYIFESEQLIYEDAQGIKLCIRENSSVRTLTGSKIITFLDRKKKCNIKINNFFNECCNKNLSIDWKYKINEMPDLSLKMDSFCNFFKSIWLKSKMIYFLKPEATFNNFWGTIGKLPNFDYISKTLEFQIDFFVVSIIPEIFSKYKILSKRLGSLIEYYSGSILFKINKYFEIENYSYKFDDELFELNIQNIKRNQLKNIIKIDENEMFQINKTLESKIIGYNNNFNKYSIEHIVEEIKKNLNSS